MKSLKDALVDYDLALLQAIADKRGLEQPTTHNPDTLAGFCEALLSPVSIAIALDDLQPAETDALNDLIGGGNVLEAPKFYRLYGDIRPMGSNRLLREKPWQAPASAAEGLWYRGLIFKGFRHTLNGPEEVIFIPDDLQAHLPITPAKTSSFQVAIASDPKIVLPSAAFAREDLFTLLVYIQTNLIRLEAGDAIPDRHRQAIQTQFSQTNFPNEAATSGWFEFVLHLARRLDYLVKQGRRLKLNTESVRDWLQKNAWSQLRQLQDTWRSDPTWNDLWHTTGLFPKETGWENSPLLGRAKILGYLGQLPVGEWISFNQFIQAIKKSEPDFQRPDGDYQSWYIYDSGGQPLMGFEHWDEVEGRLIRYMVETILFSLGVVELGTPAETLAATTFRLTPLGQAFFSPDASNAEPQPKQPLALRINAANFSLRVPHQASLYDRFQLARFAELLRREETRNIYQITRESYHKGQEQSIALEQILAFLTRSTRAQLPLALVEKLRNWDRRSGSVKLETLAVLRVNQEDMVSELLNHREIGPFLDQPFGAMAILIPQKNVDQVRKLLIKFGYLEEDA